MIILPRTVFVCGSSRLPINLICIFLRAAVEEGLRERQNVEGRSMVFFHNINPGARVQVRWRGEIENGTIRYAGSLVAKDGEWVGIELDNRVGNTSGLYKGIQYFHCRDGHGIFTHARNIRFVPSKRTLHDTYKPVSKTSSIDETLFAKTEVTPVKSYSDPEVISTKYLDRVKTMIQGEVSWPEAKTRFNKSHLVGAHIPSGTRQRSHSAASFRQEEDYSLNKHFISPSSIPNIHVPRPILKRMLRFEYFGTTIPRFSGFNGYYSVGLELETQLHIFEFSKWVIHAWLV